MYAHLKLDRTEPCSKDHLNSLHRNSATMPTHFLSNQVGSRSDAHCLSGSTFTDATTSAGVTAENATAYRRLGQEMNDGASATAVAAHTPTTFFLSFLSASLYVSKTGDIEIGCVVTSLVGRSLVVTRVHCGQTVHPRPIVTMEH